MAVRQRKDGDFTGLKCAKFPYPYNTPLHWFWGWGQRIQSWLNSDNFSPSQHDWIVVKPCREAADAMMEFSVDYQGVIDEVRRSLRDVENRQEEALESDEYTVVYADSLDVLSRRIFKACEIIAEREGVANLPPSGQEKAHGAHEKKLFLKGGPSHIDVKDAIVCLDTYRDNGKSYNDILREKLNLSKEEAKKMEGRIRASRVREEHTLPPQK